MEGLFRAVLIMSCAGSALTLILLALRPITSRIFGSVWQYYIYLAALVIFIIPISFGASYSPFPEPIEPVEIAETLPETAIPINPAGVNAPEEAVVTTIPTSGERRAEVFGIQVTGVLKYIWFIGIAVFLTGALISYIRFMRLIYKNSCSADCSMFETIRAEMGIRREIAVKVSTVLDAPLMVGMINPILVLPDRELDEIGLRYVIMHELTHFKRRDLLYKWFAMFANAIHWFNPLVYLLVRRLNEDCEISCDVTVTKNFSEKEKKEYMRTIVNLMKR